MTTIALHNAVTTEAESLGGGWRNSGGSYQRNTTEEDGCSEEESDGKQRQVSSLNVAELWNYKSFPQKELEGSSGDSFHLTLI